MSKSSCNCGHCGSTGTNPRDPKTICSLLPQLDCKQCGFETCMEFAVSLAKGKSDVED